MPNTPAPRRLTAKQRRFIDEYLVDMNGAVAAFVKAMAVRQPRVMLPAMAYLRPDLDVS